VATTGTTITTRTGLPTGTRTAKVVRGTADATLYQFDAKQKRAIGALIDGSGKSFCTGTLVGDNVVLTAAHCVRGIDTDLYRYAIGDDIAQPDQVFDVVASRANPLWDGKTVAHDNALLFLQQSASRVTTPVPINREPVNVLVNQSVQNVGYGAIDPNNVGGNTQRWWTVEPITSVDENSIVVDGRGVSSTCKGDSGSPSLHQFQDGQLRVIGTLHGGETSCIGLDKYARVDTDSDWLLSGGGTIPLPYGTEQSFALPYVTVPEMQRAGLGWWIGLPLAGMLVGMVFGRLVARRKKR